MNTPPENGGAMSCRIKRANLTPMARNINAWSLGDARRGLPEAETGPMQKQRCHADAAAKRGDLWNETAARRTIGCCSPRRMRFGETAYAASADKPKRRFEKGQFAPPGSGFVALFFNPEDATAQLCTGLRSSSAKARTASPTKAGPR